MTWRALPRSRTTAVVVGAGLIVALLGTRLFGNMLDPFDDHHAVPLSPQQRSLADQIEQLRADDGLFTAAIGAAGRPGLYESAHGLTALRAAGGKDPRISGSVNSLRKGFSAELEREPFAARVWLSRIESATGRKLHTRQDEAELLNHFSAKGYFRNPGSDSGDVSALLNDTSEALTALDEFGARLSDERRAAVRTWLATAERSAPDRPVQLHHLARIADAVGESPRRDLSERAETWWRAVGAKLTSASGETDVIEAAYFVLLADRLGIDLADRRAHLRAVLSPERPVSTDTQVAALTARAWQALGGPAKELDGLTERLEKRRLPSGLMSSVQVRQGSLTSTYEVVRLRMVAGLPLDDPELRDALTAMRSSVLADYDPLLRGAWLSLMDTVGGKVPEQERHRIVAAVEAAVPRTVDERNVEVWNRYTDILTGLDEPVPAAEPTAWKADSPEHRYGRSLLINGLDRVERLSTLNNLPPAAELVAQAEERLREGTVREGAEALEAAHALGWTPDATAATRIGALLEKRRTCPGAGAFYRDSARDTECGVPGTRAGYRIVALLEGARPVERAAR